jgi:hypothetical protein
MDSEQVLENSGHMSAALFEFHWDLCDMQNSLFQTIMNYEQGRRQFVVAYFRGCPRICLGGGRGRRKSQCMSRSMYAVSQLTFAVSACWLQVHSNATARTFSLTEFWKNNCLRLQVFWDLTLCRWMCCFRRFEGTQCLYLQVSSSPGLLLPNFQLALSSRLYTYHSHTLQVYWFHSSFFKSSSSTYSGFPVSVSRFL